MKNIVYFFPIELLQDFLSNPYRSIQICTDFSLLAVVDALEEKGTKRKTAIRKACDSLGMTVGKEWLADAKRERIQKILGNKKCSYTHIAHSFTWEWNYRYKDDFCGEPPTEKESVAFLCYLALCSIAGRKTNKDTLTTLNVLFARMSGNSVYKGQSSIDERLKVYMTRKRFTSLKKSVAEKFNVEWREGKQRGITFRIVAKPKPAEQEPAERPF